MRVRTAALLSLVLLFPAGCAYQNQYTFAATRKLLDSDAPTATKSFFAPLVCLGEGIWAPAAAYIDARNNAREVHHVYLSYIGTRTLFDQDMNVFYKILGSVFVASVDTIWFPIGGTMDTFYALTRSEGDGPQTKPSSTSDSKQ